MSPLSSDPSPDYSGNHKGRKKGSRVGQTGAGSAKPAEEAMCDLTTPSSPAHALHSRDSPMRAAGERRRAPRFRPMTFPRKRAVTACETCRAKKTKCDNQRPQCASCSRQGISCSYDDRLDHSSFDPASLLILQKLDQALQKLDSIDNAAVDARESDPASINPTVYNLETHDSDLPGTAECLEVPTSFSSTDCILSWPIFAGKWPPHYLAQAVLAAQIKPGSRVERGRRGINEEEIPLLVDRFIQLVHSKNPVFEVGQLRAAARKIAEDGASWDAESCIVLLACALGAIAKPFDSRYEGGSLHDRDSLTESAAMRETAEAYYQLARRRIGLIDPGLMAAQCHMLSGIYLMYVLDPLRAWLEFHQAGSIYRLFLQAAASFHEDGYSLPESMQLQRSIEQRVYWTILKSECEVRVHLDVAQSDLCKLDYPHLFPSPPMPRTPAENPTGAFTDPSPPSDVTDFATSTRSPASSFVLQEAEQQTWFYYLSEIAVRRIENRMLTALYKSEHESWCPTRLPAMLGAAGEIEAQLDTWQSSLPDTLRMQKPRNATVINELRYVTEGRVLCLRSMLYRPFLYYALHHGQSSQTSDNVIHRLQELVAKSLSTCVALNAGHAMTYRHHGTWYGLRECVASSLMLYAAGLGGLITFDEIDIPVAEDESRPRNPYRQAVLLCIERLRYWEAEAPADIARAREMLETIVRSIQ